MVGSRDRRITAISAMDNREYMRQWNYIKKHPNCTSVPPDPRKDGRRRYKKPRWQADPRITADINELVEYNRQYKYLSAHPDCASIPPRKRKVYKRREASDLPKHLISVKPCEDRKSYDRQYGWLRRNPNAKSIPQHVIDGPIYKKRDSRLGLLKSSVPRKRPQIFITKVELTCCGLDGDDV